MTSRNSPWNKSETGNAPFLLSPAGKDYLWGGRRLKDDFAKELDLEPLAETWECSTHPDGLSVVSSGVFKGKTLAEVVKEHPEFLGSHPKTKGELPILIKFIDAKQDLSVQVHPNDEFAAKYENGQMGKSEMWYVLDAAKDARLIYGFRHTVTKETLRKSLENGTVEKYLQKVPVRKDDLFYIEAGTVHAIGAGALIVEIQESSNLTYRMYDYDRVDKNGRKRPLHLDKAMEAVDLRGCPEPRQPMRMLKYSPGCARELLCRCKYFEVHRMMVNTERTRILADYSADESSFRVLLCTDGCGCAFYGEGEYLPLFKGDCLFVPACSKNIKIHGTAQFLDIRG